jgi:hypothetical protein
VSRGEKGEASGLRVEGARWGGVAVAALGPAAGLLSAGWVGLGGGGEGEHDIRASSGNQSDS